ncbi:hypothetical protein [Pseudomonas sp. 21]|uniref:hypothetical protein n=1 Tax=Pseudomonas sp. 21 TaxID=1619948 RepID=UPI00069C0728|nr:hypothetical protein [Pseudomonas sp. 21]
MNDFTISLATHELLHHMIQVGGLAVCKLEREASAITANFEVLLEGDTTRVKVLIGDYNGEINLVSGFPSNHIKLRNFLEDIANGRVESGRPRDPLPSALAMTSEDHAKIESVIACGGYRKLATGHVITVHRRPSGGTAMVVSEHSESLLVSGSVNDLLLAVVEHVESHLEA